MEPQVPDSASRRDKFHLSQDPPGIVVKATGSMYFELVRTNSGFSRFGTNRSRRCNTILKQAPTPIDFI